MKRMSQYLAYNRDITRRFGNASMTLESRMMPYQFYRFAELYTEYGGDPKKVKAIVSKAGYKLEDLRKNYDHLYNGGDAAAPEEYVTEDQLVSELADAARTVNELAAMDAATYAAQPAEHRYIDSIYFEAYRQYAEQIDKKTLDANAEIGKVDMNRSRRLYEEYSANHP